MRLPFTFLLTLLAHYSVLAIAPVKRYYSTYNYYVLEHDPTVGASLAEVARELGAEVVEQVGELQHHWLLRAEKSIVGRDVSQDKTLLALERLRSRASARQESFLGSRSAEAQHAKRLASSIVYFSPQTLRRRVKRAPPPIPTSDAPLDANSTSRAVALRLGIQDPLFAQQWHIINEESPQHMMNVTALWDMGITGKGVISALVDDGLDYRNADIAENFHAAGSYDFNDHVDLPTPILFDDHHGTRCAGQIAAVKNQVCGIGIAYNSKVAGIRILSGPISDVDEAAALNYGFQNTSIYSCSWGPPDDGKAMDAPDYLIKKAVVNGIQNGRHGKGSIFVFASGNGYAHGDQCNFDGYTNSIYSITVSAVDHKGLHPYYSEPCAANLVVAYSSGSGKHIVTTDIRDKCTTTHGGTSAAAPNAVGVFALALEVRPDLTWRDVQHLCVETAQVINPEDPDWGKTAVGRSFSYKYGYGKLNGLEFVNAAKNWTLVKPQTWLTTAAVQINNGSMNLYHEMTGGDRIASGGVLNTIAITQDMLDAENIEKLEHITVQVWISHTKRGDVEVGLTSPNKIKSILAAPRWQDLDKTGYRGWTFMSVKHWGENPVGEWTIHVNDQAAENQSGSFLGWRMTLWGSSRDPTIVKTYSVPLIDTLLPPIDTNIAIPTSTSSTKTHAKPTAHLPGDHGTAEGEKHKPAFSPGPTSPTGTSMPTPDEGWFSDMSNLMSNNKWFFGAIGAVFIFGIAAAVYFWRRRMAHRKRGHYTSLRTEDEVAMDNIDRDGRRGATGPPTKELYDAFGEVDEDDEDADEETGLRSGPHVRSPGGLGFHSGFLEDDGPDSAGPTPTYKDEPDASGDSREPNTQSETRSPDTVSGESWVHATSESEPQS